MRFAFHFAAVLVLGLAGLARADGDAYFHVPLDDVPLTEGQRPAPPSNTDWRMSQRWTALRPYAVLDGPGEAIVWDGNYNNRFSPLIGAGAEKPVTTLDVRSSRPGDVTGRLFLPKTDASGMVALKFKLPASKATAEARSQFYTDLTFYYDELIDRGIPGAAWFRYRARAAAAQTGKETQEKLQEQRTANRGQPNQDGLDDTYALFSGGHSLSENLQLDRALPPINKAENYTVALDSLEGITVSPMDWKTLVADKKPQADALAALIPADQHAIFFPSFNALIAVADEADRFGTPALQYTEQLSEDYGTRARYERQLGVSLTGLGKLIGPHLIGSIAITGSDPYLRTGSDLAILLQPRDQIAPAMLKQMILAQITLASQRYADAESVTTKADGIEVTAIQTPDRSLSALVAVFGNAVLVTNSKAQVDKVDDAHAGRTPALSSLPEYTFFRDRYKLGADDESALIVLSDATIRRWCSARWRIADSRRTRAAAVMSDLQASHLDQLVSGKLSEVELQSDFAVPQLGALKLGADGVTSPTYGSLDFMTPIAELTIEKVTSSEADGYKRWRDSYQMNWRNYFDPIALRLTVQPGHVAADLTVMPLIGNSEYQQFQQLSSGVSLAPLAGDPHDALLHAILAINPKSPLLQPGANQIGQLAPGINVDPLSWLGQSIALYMDDDPFWDELAQAKEPEKFLTANVDRLPVGLRVGVSNGFKLAGFLVAVHVFVDQSAPGMTVWQTQTYKDRAYVKITASEQAKGNEPELKNAALFYLADGDSLLLTPSEPLLRRAIDRKLASNPQTRPSTEPAEAIVPPATQPAVAPKPWLGTSLCLRGQARALDLFNTGLRAEFQAAQQATAWQSLPILNELHRQYPGQDPIQLYRRFFQATLQDPAGGSYIWNDALQTMESVSYGCPAQPKTGPDRPSLLSGLHSVDLGLSFENAGLRAKAALERTTAQ